MEIEKIVAKLFSQHVTRHTINIINGSEKSSDEIFIKNDDTVSINFLLVLRLLYSSYYRQDEFYFKEEFVKDIEYEIKKLFTHLNRVDNTIDQFEIIMRIITQYITKMYDHELPTNVQEIFVLDKVNTIAVFEQRIYRYIVDDLVSKKYVWPIFAGSHTGPFNITAFKKINTKNCTLLEVQEDVEDIDAIDENELKEYCDNIDCNVFEYNRKTLQVSFYKYYDNLYLERDTSPFLVNRRYLFTDWGFTTIKKDLPQDIYNDLDGAFYTRTKGAKFGIIKSKDNQRRPLYDYFEYTQDLFDSTVYDFSNDKYFLYTVSPSYIERYYRFTSGNKLPTRYDYYALSTANAPSGSLNCQIHLDDSMDLLTVDLNDTLIQRYTGPGKRRNPNFEEIFVFVLKPAEPIAIDPPAEPKNVTIFIIIGIILILGLGVGFFLLKK